MGIYALRRDPTSLLVLGAWAGGGPATPASTAEKEVVQVTEAQYFQTRQQTFQGSSQPRWKLTGDFPSQVVTEETDARPMTRWIADPNGAALSTSDGYVEYVLDYSPNNQGAGEIRVEVIDDQGNVRTNVNVTRRITINTKRLRVVVTNGVATIPVPTRTPREITVSPNEDFNLENLLTVIVADTEF